MVTQLKSKDLPEPWHSSKKKTGGMPRPKSIASKVSDPKDLGAHEWHTEPKKRGRPCAKSAAKASAAPKGLKKARPLPTSTVNVLLGVSATSIADVEELRRKRQADAEASGRTVRTISPHQRRKKSLTNVTGNSTAKDGDDDLEAAGGSVPPKYPPKPSQILQLTEDNFGEKSNARMEVEEVEEGRERIPSRRPGKEPVQDHVDDGSAHYEHHHQRWLPLQGLVDTDSSSDSRHRSRDQQEGRTCRVPSPTKKNSRELYEDKRVGRSKSRNEGLHAYKERLQECPSRSPRRKLSWSSRVPESWSPTRSKSRSPVRWRGGRLERNDHLFQEHDEYPFSYRVREDYRPSQGLYNGNRHHRSQYESSSPENSRKQRRSCSREDGRRTQQRKRTSYSSMSPPRRSMNLVDSMSKERIDCGVVREDQIVDLSPTSDRRRRRHEQAFVEAEKTRRLREGNKPFYLILDREGRPYGPGKPAWIAEINKLATGLDPSCTHIRKQTFEDVQTFKDRLNENFDYSRTLNEDYLRALMGKAVTKRRGELISLIRKNAKPLKYIDIDIWRRLEKLAYSKQREDKSEQGRYANSCRRVVGRTGRRGIDGVREKLRSLLGRSPDPSEVEEEMQRDKGYGGEKRKRPVLALKEDTNSTEVIRVDEDPRDRRSMRNSSRNDSDADSDEPLRHEACSIIEREGRFSVYGGADRDVSARAADGAQRSVADMEANEMTRNDYIEKLEAKIKQLQEEKAKVSTGNLDATSSKIMN